MTFHSQFSRLSRGKSFFGWPQIIFHVCECIVVGLCHVQWCLAVKCLWLSSEGGGCSLNLANTPPKHSQMHFLAYEFIQHLVSSSRRSVLLVHSWTCGQYGTAFWISFAKSAERAAGHNICVLWPLCWKQQLRIKFATRIVLLNFHQWPWTSAKLFANFIFSHGGVFEGVNKQLVKIHEHQIVLSLNWLIPDHVHVHVLIMLDSEVTLIH